MGANEPKTIQTSLKFNSVTFVNFPAYVGNDGEVTYNLMLAVVADRYAEQFPDSVRSAITVDFNKLDVDKLVQEAKDALGIKSPFANREEAYLAEQELIKILIAKGWNVTESENE